MMVILLNVKIYVLVTVEVLAVAFIPEGLQLGANGVPGQGLPRRRVCRVWYTCCPFLVLLNFFT